MKKALKNLFLSLGILAVVFSFDYISISNPSSVSAQAQPSEYIQIADGVYQNNLSYNLTNSTLPTSYDLRDYINIEVENQEQYGICWAFSSLSTLETHIALKYNEYYDFSEIHLSSVLFEHNQYDNNAFTAGGNFWQFKLYCDQGLGPVLEEEMQFSTFFEANNSNTYEQYSIDYYKANKDKFTDIVQVDSYIQFQDASTLTTQEEILSNRNAIKSHIMKNGACDIMINADYFNYNSNGDYAGTYYLADPINPINHAVTIVGWDDNYTNGNKTGAYIVLNSWGNNWGNNGYFYIFYDHIQVESSVSGILDVNMSRTNDVINNLDEITGEYGYMNVNRIATYGVPIDLSKKQNEFIQKIAVPIIFDTSASLPKFYAYLFNDSDLNSILIQSNNTYAFNLSAFQKDLIELTGTHIYNSMRTNLHQTHTIELFEPLKITKKYALILISGNETLHWVICAEKSSDNFLNDFYFARDDFTSSAINQLNSFSSGTYQTPIFITTSTSANQTSNLSIYQDASLYIDGDNIIKNALRTNDELIFEFSNPIYLENANISIYKPTHTLTNLTQNDYTNKFKIERTSSQLAIHFNSFYDDTLGGRYVIKIEDGDNIYFRAFNVLPPIGKTVLISSSGNGTVSENTAFSVINGESKQISFSTPKGYVLGDIRVNNVSISAQELSLAIKNGYYSLTNITADTLVHFDFVEKIYANYKVYYYIEALTETDFLIDGVYFLAPSSETHSGEIDSLTQVVPYDIEGFTTQPVSQEIILEDDSTIVNVFYKRNTYTVTVNNSFGVESTSGHGTYKFEEAVTISAILDESHTLAPWTSSFPEIMDVNSPTLSFNMPAMDIQITANAVYKQFRIESLAGENGQISPQAHNIYNYGECPTYYISPNQHYKIESIQIDGVALQEDLLNLAIVNGYYTFDPIIANHSIYVTFAPVEYAITVTQSPNGTISPESCTAIYNTNKTFTITADIGYKIQSLIINGEEVLSGNLSIYTFEKISKDCTISAVFAPRNDIKYRVNHYQESLSTTNVQLGDLYYSLVEWEIKVGTTKEQTNATTNHYAGFIAQKIEQQEIKADGSTIINVYYNRNNYALTVNSSEGIASTSGQGIYKFGQSVRVSCTLAPSHKFETWITDFEQIKYLQNTTLSFNMPANSVTLTAKAIIKTFNITVGDSPNGTLLPKTATNITYGSNQTFTFEPNAHYEIKRILIDNIALSGNALKTAIQQKRYTFTNIIRDHSISVEFSPLVYSITVKQNANGTISPESCLSAYNTNKTFTITPNTGYKVVRLIINDNIITQGDLTSYTFQNISHDCSISAEFAVQDFVIRTIFIGGNASLNIDAEHICYYGQNIYYFIKVDFGYGIKNITINGKPFDIFNELNFNTITENKIIEIEVVKLFDITTIADKFGKISQSAQVLEGGSYTVDITPNFGYEINEIFVDNQPVDLAEFYTFKDITQNHTISATFKAKVMPVKFSVDANCSIKPSTVAEGATFNEDYTFEVDLKRGYIVDKIIVNDVVYTGTGRTFTVKNVSGDLKIEVQTKYNQALFANFNTATILFIGAIGVAVILTVILLIIKNKKPSTPKRKTLGAATATAQTNAVQNVSVSQNKNKTVNSESPMEQKSSQAKKSISAPQSAIKSNETQIINDNETKTEQAITTRKDINQATLETPINKTDTAPSTQAQAQKPKQVEKIETEPATPAQKTVAQAPTPKQPPKIPPRPPVSRV